MRPLRKLLPDGSVSLALTRYSAWLNPMVRTQPEESNCSFDSMAPWLSSESKLKLLPKLASGTGSPFPSTTQNSIRRFGP